jgi:hypothetical protein
MPICKKCGVEIEATYSSCPLCGAPIGNNTIKQEEKIPTKPQLKEPAISHPWFLELFSFFSLASAIIVFAVDFAYSANLTWSRIPLISIIFTWLFVFFIHHFKKKPYLLVTLEMIDFFLFLWLLDILIPAFFLFFKLAFPIILVVGILFLLVILWVRSFKLSTLTALSAGTFAIGIFLVCLEVILNRFKNNTIFISWSIVAFACILLVSGLFLYLQFRINKKGSNLKKYFHI